jgi:hypothetical protein
MYVIMALAEKSKIIIHKNLMMRELHFLFYAANVFSLHFLKIFGRGEQKLFTNTPFDDRSKLS